MRTLAFITCIWLAQFAHLRKKMEKARIVAIVEKKKG
jgi:hypothetical protein